MSLYTLSAHSASTFAPRPNASRAAFQSVVVAAVHALQRAIGRVREAEKSALSLAQQQKVAAVAEDLQASADDLREQLDAQGRCILGEPRTLREKVAQAGTKVQHALATRKEREVSPSWPFALTEAVETLDDEADQLAELAAAQSEGTPAGALSRNVEARLRAHHDALLGEAERWID